MIIKIVEKKVISCSVCENSTDSSKIKNIIDEHTQLYFECSSPSIGKHSLNGTAEFDSFVKNTCSDMDIIIVGEVSDKIGPSRVIKISIQELKKIVYVTDAWIYLMNNNGKTVDTFSC